MSNTINEYNELLKQLCLQTIPNNYIILKFLKGCGYSEILIIPKYSNIGDLLQLALVQFGEWMLDTIYYLNNENEKIYINQLPRAMLVRDLLRNLKWAYAIDECIHNVHILRYGACECYMDIVCQECGNCV